MLLAQVTENSEKVVEKTRARGLQPVFGTTFWLFGLGPRGELKVSESHEQSRAFSSHATRMHKTGGWALGPGGQDAAAAAGNRCQWYVCGRQLC